MDSKGSVGPVKLYSSKPRSLDVATKLGCSIKVPLCILAESESSLSPEPNALGVSIIDSTSHESSNSILALPIQLETSSESGSYAPTTVTNLSCDSQLGDQFSICIDGSSKAGSEREVTVLAEDTVRGCYSSNSC